MNSTTETINCYDKALVNEVECALITRSRKFVRINALREGSGLLE